ncbi:MAG: hypothetical protein NVS2B12_08830 [Ktedonobacteraceae bacterium]
MCHCHKKEMFWQYPETQKKAIDKRIWVWHTTKAVENKTIITAHTTTMLLSVRI